VRRSLKYFASLFLIPAVKWYLRKERQYTFKGTTVTVWPGVFHPGFFSSTIFLLDYLQEQPLENRRLLELGCGTALISVICAKADAKVWAVDLSIKALENAKHNAAKNNVAPTFVHSDLFLNIEKQQFDWIIINPPYYALEAQNEEELAWNCGEHFEYFTKLFHSIGDYMHNTSKVIMVLTKGCDQKKIFSIAIENGFRMKMIREKKVMFDEKDFLYEIEKT
jgi:release factor glutamine methyltransferase